MLFQKKAILLVSALLATQFYCADAAFGDGLRGKHKHRVARKNGKKKGKKDKSKYSNLFPRCAV
jgi:hypothetical protein